MNPPPLPISISCSWIKAIECWAMIALRSFMVGPGKGAALEVTPHPHTLLLLLLQVRPEESPRLEAFIKKSLLPQEARALFYTTSSFV